MKKTSICIKYISILVVVIFTAYSNLYAQVEFDTVPEVQKMPDSAFIGIDSTNIYYFSGTFDSLKSGSLKTIDTSTQYFHQSDPLFKHNGIYSTLSNIGLAHKNLLFSPTNSIGYFMENQSFPKYIYTNDKVKYYHQYIPYTEAEYIIGSKKEQNFSIIFTRELWKRFTIGVDFALNNSPGPYKNSKSDDKRVYFTVQWYTENARYGIIANYLSNKLVMQENGGIAVDSIFEDDLESDRRVIPINLETATNTVKESGFFVEQYFNLLKPHSDSVPRKIDVGHISYSFNYQRNQLLYTDNYGVSDFYTGHLQPIDSSMTRDSVYQHRLRNKFRWSSIGYHDDPGNQLFHIYFGLIYDFIRQEFPHSIDTLHTPNPLSKDINQLTAFGGIGFNLFKLTKLKAYAEYVISKESTSDFKFTATLDQLLGSNKRNIGSIFAGIDLITRTPSWYYEHYFSNYYRWNNSFKQENHFTIYGEYRFKQMAAGVRFNTIGNYTYFNKEMRPAQLDKAATILQLYFRGTIPIKKFGINTRVVYQSASASDVIKLPDLSGTLNIYFKSPIFKRAATLQTGFQFYYFSSFTANAYMPAVRDFYLQTEKTIGNYAYADVYLTLQIKNARLFLKYAHFNSLFGNSDYYLAPHYPARDARFYFGISWGFFN